MNKKLQNLVGYIGLTHLGINYLTSSLNKKYKVIAYDEDRKKIDNLKKNIIEFKEPMLKETILKKKSNINFTNNLNDLKKCKIVFFSQDVDTDNNNKSNISKIKKNVEKSIKYLDKNAVFVILSQVDFGFTRKIKFKKNNLYYQVETLVFGEAVQRANNPERLIIGTENETDKINKEYLNYIKKFNCPLIRMTYESAELTKKAINIFLCSTITATNQFTELCEKTSANWKHISKALILDKRIGKYAYVKPALGISGGNLERDIKTIEELNKKYKIDNKFIESINLFSKKKKNWVKNILKKKYIVNKKTNFGVLGLAYKENTNSLKNSSSILLIKQLCKKNKVFGYDPEAKNFKLKNFQRLKSLKDVLRFSKIIIIMTPWNEFKKIKKNILSKSLLNKIVIDPYDVIKNKELYKNTKFFILGKKSS